MPLHAALAFEGVLHEAQTPPHESVPEGHWHALFTHWAPLWHGVPQAEQLFGSAVVSTQAPEQEV